MGLGERMFKGMAWGAIDRLSMQLIQFIIGIVLARILSPSEYGIVGILYVFIAISQVFIDSGFTKALIQKQNRSENDISTVFIFNILISVGCYILLYISAPLIQDFYNISQLSLLLRILALSLIINSIYTVPITLYTINLDFKVLTKVNFIAGVIAGFIAIYFAYIGYGVWSLVIQTLVRSFIIAVLIWYHLKWQPNWTFSKVSLKSLFAFGSKLLVSSLLNITVNKSYELVIVKISSTKDLGYYTRGAQFADFVFGIINSIVDRVLLPGLAAIQDQKEVLINHIRSIIKITALVVIPIFLLLAVMAEPLVSVLLTSKWLPSVPILQIFCIARLITLISGININLLYIIGRTDLALKQQYLKIIVRVSLFIVAFKFGIYYIALAELASTIIHFFINTYYPSRIMNYGTFNQLKDMSVIFGISLFMVLISYCLILLIPNAIIKVCIIPPIAIFTYLGLVYLFKIPEYFILRNKIKLFLK